MQIMYQPRPNATYKTKTKISDNPHPTNCLLLTGVPNGIPKLSAYVLPLILLPFFRGVLILLGLSLREFCLLQSTSPSVPMRLAGWS